MPDRKIGFYPLLKGIYDRIKDDDLTSEYRIYNINAPANTAFPYITYGTPYGGKHSMSAADIPLEDNVVLIHFWSKLDTDKEVAQMMDNVSQALDLDNLDGIALTIDGYTQVILTLDYADIIADDTEPAEIIMHGILRIRCVMA